MKKKILLVSILWVIVTVIPCYTTAQNTLHINDIQVEGNQKTKKHIILREIPFAIGDSVPIVKLNSELEEAKERLLFTYLFRDVTINLTDLTQVNDSLYSTVISIKVEENGVLGLAPVLELADRNINVWLFDQNHSLERINIGAKFLNRNITRRQDVLGLKAQIGYTQKVEIKYNLPDLRALPGWGFNISGLYSRSKEVRINTIGNKEVFFSDFDQFHFKRLRLRAGISYRPDIYQNISLSTGYHKYSLSDTAAAINPHFFGKGKKTQRFMDIQLKWNGDYRDRLLLPRKGQRFHLLLEKKGFTSRAGLHTYEIEALYGKYFTVNNYIISSQIKGRVTISKGDLPYFNRTALGYDDDFISGYGYYLIDGRSYIYMKNSVSLHTFDINFNLGKLMIIKSLRDVRLQTYLSFRYDIGFTDNKRFADINPLNNVFVYGYGPSIDVIYNETIHASALFGINKKNETGFYFRITSAF